MTRVVRTALILIGAAAALVILALAMLISGDGSEDKARPSGIQVAAPVDTTAAAIIEHELDLGFPQVGDVVTSPLFIEGTSDARQVGYRLFGGGKLPLAEGTIVSDGEGRFSTTVEFTNTCCIEMTLQVFALQPDTGLRISIPLGYPETS